MSDNVLIEGRFVVCAACRFGKDEDALVVTGARHYDGIMHAQIKAIGGKRRLKELYGSAIAKQGFIDQFGVFMDRYEALEVATAAGQVNVRRSKTSPEDRLFSEDLY